jgi:MYXO-CTERM domain-containing protein
MRRISPAFAFAAVLLASSPALAAHHVMRVSEILLSEGGDDAVQYVELTDMNAESFPNDPYKLVTYDVDGAELESMDLTIGAGTARYYVATTAADAVFGPDGEAELTIALPTEGQLCFELNDGTKISCISWGCINTVVTAMYDTGEGAPPPDGMSLQRQGDGSYNLGEPTPDANNAVGTPAAACATDPDAGPSDIDSGPVSGDDGGPGSPDGGGNGGDGSGDDDDSGCGCRTSSTGGAASMVLVLGIYLALSRTRRRRN